MTQPKLIVIGNEKGGAGKSTLAIHIVAGLLNGGASVSILDLDIRQQSLGHFFANRKAWLDANGQTAPMPREHVLEALLASQPEEVVLERFQSALAEAAASDFILIDTPGADTALSRNAHSKADLIVTPMNDSFVDFDTLGVVDPVSLELKRPSLYSETVWNSRKQKAMETGQAIDWVVLRNRLAPTEARNRRRVDDRVQALSRRVGFRIGPGLRDRVIYRELFPFGLTVADLSPTIKPVAISLQHVAARQELRALMASLNLPLDGAARVSVD